MYSLREHDMILGRKWFAQTGVLIDCKNRCLIWPEGMLQARGWGRVLTTMKKALEPAATNSQHQEDADRRDPAMAAKEATRPRTILQRPVGSRPPTWKEDQIEQYHKINNELKSYPTWDASSGPRQPEKEEAKLSKPTIDICGITAAAF
ncbi:hypothetical protein GP486_007366 [Trichoglossum hirsutum]|uniref:Uncharacterized protein n=1 Tax=Trichoglossum hirsutum TaxID=265104 RepID=A0A9P8IFW9_9PEZI|nr:hypothetical protein GP486_007366 [Trichoglossum hirsutum]